MSEIQKLKGIFLHKIRYSENSVIARIYTDQLGMQSFIIRGVGEKTKAKKSGLLQPLTLLEMVVYYNHKRNIQQTKELSADYHFKNLQQDDLVRSSIAVFINELIYKSIREEESNYPMFDFLYNSIRFLDTTKNYLNFHLVFTVQFTKFLGFYPSMGSSDTEFFDLREGYFVSSKPLHEDFIPSSMVQYFQGLLKTDYENAGNLKLNNRQRKDLLEYLLLYYALQLHGFGKMKSHHVLETVLS